MDPLWNFFFATIATLVAALISFAAARLRFSLSPMARTLLDVLFLAPLVTPPSLLAWLLFAVNIKNEIVLLAGDTLTAVPILYLCAWIGFRRVRQEWIDAARIQGDGPCGLFWHVWFPTARLWLLAGFVLALLRAWVLPVLLFAFK